MRDLFLKFATNEQLEVLLQKYLQECEGLGERIPSPVLWLGGKKVFHVKTDNPGNYTIYNKKRKRISPDTRIYIKSEMEITRKSRRFNERLDELFPNSWYEAGTGYIRVYIGNGTLMVDGIRTLYEFRCWVTSLHRIQYPEEYEFSI